MYFIASKSPGNIAGIHNEWIYSACKIKKTLVIFRKKITSIDGWEEYFDTNFILSKPLKCNCSNGIPVAYGVIDSLFIIIGRGKLNSVTGLHFFAVNLNSVTLWNFEQSYPLTKSDFEDFCSECYQLNIFEYENRHWIIDSWKFKSSINNGYEDIKWWSSNIFKQIDKSANTDKDNCYIILNRKPCFEPISNHRIASNIGIIENQIYHIYYGDDKKIYVTGIANSEMPATIAEESDLKEWDDIGFWNYNKKLYCLALKKIPDKECEIQFHEINVKFVDNNTYTGHPCITFVQKFSFVFHDMFPNLHQFRFFVTPKVIIFQNDRQIITVIDENGFNSTVFSNIKPPSGRKKKLPPNEKAPSKTQKKKRLNNQGQ